MEPWNDWFHEGFKSKALTMPRVNITGKRNGQLLTLMLPPREQRNCVRRGLQNRYGRK
jgi:hypothetical protein